MESGVYGVESEANVRAGSANKMDKERYILRKGTHLGTNRIFPDQILGGRPQTDAEYLRVR